MSPGELPTNATRSGRLNRVEHSMHATVPRLGSMRKRRKEAGEACTNVRTEFGTRGCYLAVPYSSELAKPGDAPGWACAANPCGSESRVNALRLAMLTPGRALAWAGNEETICPL